jgi:hypothetical protein
MRLDVPPNDDMRPSASQRDAFDRLEWWNEHAAAPAAA